MYVRSHREGEEVQEERAVEMIFYGDHQVEERGGRRRRRRCAERERGRSMAEKDGEIMGRAGLGQAGGVFQVKAH